MADRNDAVTMSLEEAKILVMQGMKGDPGESPRINPENNHWEVYDNDTEQWVDTGVSARGPKGDPGSGGEGGSLPEVDSSDVGKVLRVNSDAEWDVLDPPVGVPDYSTAQDGQVLSILTTEGGRGMFWATPSKLPDYSNADSGNVLKVVNRGGTRETVWDTPAYPILVYKNGNNYTVHSAVTAEKVVANKGNLVIILNGNVLYNCVGALTSDFAYGHFYFVAAKPTDSAIETEWLDLSFFTGANSSVSVTPFSFDIEGLPAVTSSDAWKVLTVNGQGVWTPLPCPEKVIYLRHYVNAADGIQAHTILQYANGAWVTANGAAIAEMIEEGGVYPIISDYNGTSFPLFYKLEQVLVNIQLVFRATQPNGTATVLVLPWASSIASTFDVVADLPAVTAEDNGKVLKVVNGVWAAVSE